MPKLPISVFHCRSSHRIPTWHQGRFLAYALPHSGRGDQVGLGPMGCKLSTKIGTRCLIIFWNLHINLIGKPFVSHMILSLKELALSGRAQIIFLS